MDGSREREGKERKCLSVKSEMKTKKA